MNTFGVIMLYLFKKTRDKGFSLVELLVVMLIMGVIAGIATPIYLNQKSRSYRSVAESNGHALLETLTSGLLGTTSFGTTNGTIVVDTSVSPATVTITLGSGATSPSPLTQLMSTGVSASGVTYANTTQWCLDTVNNGQHVIYTDSGETNTQTSCGLTPGTNFVPVSISGGTLTSDATYYYRTFLSSGTLTITGTATVDSLVIAAGGAGENGGGGAGGVLYTAGASVPANSYSVVVGTGVANAQGGNSSFNSNIAIGGGCGSTGTPCPGMNGGSGGGPNGLGTSGQGFAGGTVGWAGGGGAGGPGNDVSNGGGHSDGGPGTCAYSTWATATGTGVSGCYAGGGGGFSAGVGGTGGGASAGNSPVAVPNTGSGAGYNSNVPIGGASGIVIIRYTRSQVGG